jgi:branched-chain amino acid transport system permease protein
MRKNTLPIVALLVALAGLAALPLVIHQDNIFNLVIRVYLYVMLASSWNVLGGYTGQTNLGHAAFFGLGALATRILWLGGWSLFPSLLVSSGVAVAFALVIGGPAFRLRGVYFAIGTLALAQILNVTVGNILPEITSLPAQALATYKLLPRYYVFLGLAAFTVAIAFALVRSPLGLGLMAVREEEDAAESLGISALQHKLLALAVSAFLAGLAGGAFAYYQVGYYPQFPFSPEWTFDSVMVTYLGGTGTLVGPIIGAVFYVVTQELLALKLADYHLIIFGALFVIVVLFLPGGFVEAWQKLNKAFFRHFKRMSRNPEVLSAPAVGPVAKEREDLSK